MSESLTLEAFTKLLLTHSSNEYESNDCSYCSDTESSVMASAAQERAEESGAALIAAYDEQRSRADTAEAERDAARAVADAARTFAAKLNLIHAHPSFQSVWSFYNVHGLTYTGPTYEHEFAALNAALEALAERP